MTPIPRWYQEKAVSDLWAWFAAGNDGNPCIEMTTGAGKSHVIALICRDALQSWPDTRILMLTHVKELIAQNAEKMRQYWPGAPLGIYSAGMRKRDLAEPITFGSVQSLRDKSAAIGFIDLCLIDECHLVANKDEGAYRKLISELREINPRLRVIGLTATPFRMGHGLITDEPAIFNRIIKPVTIHELLNEGHIAPLRSKHTASKLDFARVAIRGGDYAPAELQAAVDTDDQNKSVAAEIVAKGTEEKRRHWLVFATGIEHSEHLAEEIRALGITCEALHSKRTNSDRDSIIKRFKSGEIQALTNPAMLTTGFDFPDIDLIGLVRPTLSVNLYCQIAGRGMRPKSHTDHCLVLDFAGAVSRHGPITSVRTPEKSRGKGLGEAPVKVCVHCSEIVALNSRICPACGEPFPEPVTAKERFRLHDDDIMGERGNEIEITRWRWEPHTSKAGNQMLKVRYYGDMLATPVDEYMTVGHSGKAGEIARRTLAGIASASGAKLDPTSDLETQSIALNSAEPPSIVEYHRDGKFFRVMRRAWLDSGQMRMIG